MADTIKFKILMHYSYHMQLTKANGHGNMWQAASKLTIISQKVLSSSSNPSPNHIPVAAPLGVQLESIVLGDERTQLRCVRIAVIAEAPHTLHLTHILVQTLEELACKWSVSCECIMPMLRHHSCRGSEICSIDIDEIRSS